MGTQPSVVPDPRAILEALGVPVAPQHTPITRVSGGADTAIWRVERAAGGWDGDPGFGSAPGDASDGGDGCGTGRARDARGGGGKRVFALRLFRAEQVGTCRREVAAMRAAALAGLPVPVVHVQGAWQERPALLLSWCAGRPLLGELQARPWRAWPLGVVFGRMQARIHAVPAPEALRAPPEQPDAADRWLEWAGPVDEALRTQLRAFGLRSDALLHLDYHPLNVMVDGDRISGVLDWANARAGDPRADCARTVTILRLAPSPAGASMLAGQVGTLVRRLLEYGWRRGYGQVAGSGRAAGVGGPDASSRRTETGAAVAPKRNGVDMAAFYAWAGAAMIHDLAPRPGRSGVVLTPHDLARMQRWVATWRRRARL